MQRNKKVHRCSFKKKLIIGFSIFIILIIIFDHQMRPLIKSIALNRAQIISTKVINETVLEEISRLDIDYSNVTIFEKDNNGKILAINADMKKINTLKSSVTIAIQKKISCMPKKDLSIPIGTLTGTEILNGKGPDVPMKISLSGSVLTNFRSVFESAGINQTKHQIYLDISTEVFALIPGFPVNTAISTSVLIAESIFMGEVPATFANFCKNS